MLIKRFFLSFLCLLCLGNLLYGQSPADALHALLSTKGLKHAAIGISVKQVNNDSLLLAHNPYMSLTPASVAKIMPTWFAIQKKGGDYRYRTFVYHSGVIKDGDLEGNLIIKASGDPTLDSRYFKKHSFSNSLLEQLQQRGIKRIRGKIYVDGAGTGENIPGKWLWEDISNYYGAPYLPFNYRDNLFTLNYRSGIAGNKAQLVSVEPELPGTTIRHHVKVSQTSKADVWIYGGPYSSVLCVKGEIPANCPSYIVKGAMHNPAEVFVHEISEKLKNVGIQVLNQNISSTAKTEFWHWDSPSLRDLVFYTNKLSVNLFAESLGNLIAGHNWSDKLHALLHDINIDTEGLAMEDICGLSPVNALPAQMMTDLLVYIGKQENGDFMASLPVAGTDGGLGGYCAVSPLLKNHLKAKTGSMKGVRCLAGYLNKKDGSQLAFTILINNYTCTVSQLQRAVGKFLVKLME